MKFRNVMTGAVACIVAAASMTIVSSADFSKTSDILGGKLILTVEIKSDMDTSSVQIDPHYQSADWSWDDGQIFKSFDTSKTQTIEWDFSKIKNAKPDAGVGKIGFQLRGFTKKTEITVDVKKADVVIGDKTYSLTGLLGTKTATTKDDGYGEVASFAVLKNEQGKIAAVEVGAPAVTTATKAPSGPVSATALTELKKTSDIIGGKIVLTVELMDDMNVSAITINPHYQDSTSWSWNAPQIFSPFGNSKTQTIEWEVTADAISKAKPDSAVGKIGFQLGGYSAPRQVKVNVKTANLIVGGRTYDIPGLIGTRTVPAKDDGYGNIATVEIMANDNGVIVVSEVNAAAATGTTTTAKAPAATTTTAAKSDNPSTGDSGIALVVTALMAAAGVAVIFRKKD